MLWESDVGKLKVDSSYELENVNVRQYNQMKYLTINESTIMTRCEDLDEVVDLKTVVIQGELIAVISTNTYCGCIYVPLDDESVGNA